MNGGEGHNIAPSWRLLFTVTGVAGSAAWMRRWQSRTLLYLSTFAFSGLALARGESSVRRTTYVLDIASGLFAGGAFWTLHQAFLHFREMKRGWTLMPLAAGGRDLFHSLGFGLVFAWNTHRFGSKLARGDDHAHLIQRSVADLARALVNYKAESWWGEVCGAYDELKGHATGEDGEYIFNGLGDSQHEDPARRLRGVELWLKHRDIREVDGRVEWAEEEEVNKRRFFALMHRWNEQMLPLQQVMRSEKGRLAVRSLLQEAKRAADSIVDRTEELEASAKRVENYDNALDAFQKRRGRHTSEELKEEYDPLCKQYRELWGEGAQWDQEHGRCVELVSRLVLSSGASGDQAQPIHWYDAATVAEYMEAWEARSRFVKAQNEIQTNLSMVFPETIISQYEIYNAIMPVRIGGIEEICRRCNFPKIEFCKRVSDLILDEYNRALDQKISAEREGKEVSGRDPVKVALERLGICPPRAEKTEGTEQTKAKIIDNLVERLGGSRQDAAEASAAETGQWGSWLYSTGMVALAALPFFVDPVIFSLGFGFGLFLSMHESELPPPGEPEGALWDWARSSPPFIIANQGLAHQRLGRGTLSERSERFGRLSGTEQARVMAAESCLTTLFLELGPLGAFGQGTMAGLEMRRQWGIEPSWDRLFGGDCEE